jgi:Protein of unknown function (DUF2934)
MARNTSEKTTPNRSKKAATSKPPAPVQVGSEIPVSPVSEVPKKAKSAKVAPFNLEEEIRRRAYELYLQRRATAGSVNGDEHHDWLVAEREVRSRQGDQEHHSA